MTRDEQTAGAPVLRRTKVRRLPMRQFNGTRYMLPPMLNHIVEPVT